MMTPGKKIRSLTYIIAFLLVTNIVMLVFFIFNRPSTHTSSKDQSLVATFLQNEIRFDEQQMILYQKVKKDDFDKARPSFEALQNSKKTFYQNIHDNDVPDSVINKSAAVIGEKQIAVDLLMLKHFKNVRNICTEQQLPKFDSLFKNVIAKITAGKKFKKKKE